MELGNSVRAFHGAKDQYFNEGQSREQLQNLIGAAKIAIVLSNT